MPKKSSRRSSKDNPTRIVSCGKFTLHLDSHELEKKGKSHHLTPKECRLLATLMENEGEVLSRADLMKEVWETDFLDDTRTLDVHIHWLRKKVEDDPSNPTYIRTVRGVGYWFGLRGSEE